ncbi:hypothetical protein Pelo_17825 [Pelomyxa schiedti]|nr:hypothetical protein Pelo_17825 [Pelomyxa schiedti]
MYDLQRADPELDFIISLSGWSQTITRIGMEEANGRHCASLARVAVASVSDPTTNTPTHASHATLDADMSAARSAATDHARGVHEMDEADDGKSGVAERGARLLVTPPSPSTTTTKAPPAAASATTATTCAATPPATATATAAAAATTVTNPLWLRPSPRA